jgi:Pectate lyase superfamily protein
MPKSIPTSGTLNWSIPLNDHISQLQDPTNGAINSFSQFSGRPTNLTANDIGKTYLYTQTGNIHQWTGTTWKVLNESVVNVKDYGAVGDGVVDDTVAVQFCIDLIRTGQRSSKIVIPNGKYFILNTLNLTNKLKANSNNFLLVKNLGIHIEFEHRSSLEVYNTCLIAGTGSNPAIETSGSFAVTLDNCCIVAGTSANYASSSPAKIGILQGRELSQQVGSSGGAFRQLFRNLSIQLKSDVSANGGFGTLGLVNISAEECNYENVDIFANTCYVHSSSANIRRENLNYTSLLSTNIISAFGIVFPSGFTSTVIKFTGVGRFHSWDWTGPIVLIHSPDNDFNVGSLDFGNTFFSKVTSLPPIFNSLTNKYDSQYIRDGIYDYAFEIWNCQFLKHFGQMESCGRYILLHGALDNSEINIYDSVTTPMYNAPAPYNIKDPFILLWPAPNMISTINNTRINFFDQKSDIIPAEPLLPLIRMKDSSTPYSIRNLNLTTNIRYVENVIGKNVYKGMNNCSLSFYDYDLFVGKNSMRTEFTKNIGTRTSSASRIFDIDLPIVTAQSSLSGVCKISGSLTNSSTTSSSSSKQFTSYFSFVRNTLGTIITLSPIQTTIESGVSVNVSSFDITSVTITSTVISNKITINAKPITTGALNDVITMNAKLEISHSDTLVEAPQIIF